MAMKHRRFCRQVAQDKRKLIRSRPQILIAELHRDRIRSQSFELGRAFLRVVDVHVHCLSGPQRPQRVFVRQQCQHRERRIARVVPTFALTMLQQKGNQHRQIRIITRHAFVSAQRRGRLRIPIAHQPQHEKRNRFRAARMEPLQLSSIGVAGRFLQITFGRTDQCGFHFVHISRCRRMPADGKNPTELGLFAQRQTFPTRHEHLDHAIGHGLAHPTPGKRRKRVGIVGMIPFQQMLPQVFPRVLHLRRYGLIGHGKRENHIRRHP